MTYRRREDSVALLPELEEYFETEPFSPFPRSAGMPGSGPRPMAHNFDLASEFELEEEVNRNSREYVRWVQRSLNRLIAAGLSEDGISGRNTRAAAKRFQRQAGLSADGVVGANTEAALIKAGAGDPPAYGGSSSGGYVPQPHVPASGGRGAPEPGLEHDAATVRANAVRLALQEYARWRPGGRQLAETSSAARPYLEAYWKEGAGLSSSGAADAIAKQTAWSAAFISWVMRKAGAGTAFTYSASHVKYIKAAIDNRLGGSSNPFKAYRINETAPRLGDLVCKCRSTCEANYDTVGASVRFMPTHCDVVVKIGDGEICTIGGNLSGSVSHTTVPVDSQGRLTGAPYFAVIRVGDGVGGVASTSASGSKAGTSPPEPVTTAPSWGANAFSQAFENRATGRSDVNAYLLTYLATMVYADRGLIRLIRLKSPEAISDSQQAAFLQRLQSDPRLFQSEFEKYMRRFFYDAGQPSSGSNAPPRFNYVTRPPQVGVFAKAGLAFDPEAMVIDTPGAIYVIFRGTDPVTSGWSSGEWISTDLWAFQTPTGVKVPGKVHEGMWNSLANIREELARLVTSYRAGSDKPVWVAGHSLGAAQSILFSAFLIAERGITPQGTYAIASPRPGDKQFVDYVNARMPGARLQRFDFADDPVTVLAPRKSELAVTALDLYLRAHGWKGVPDYHHPGIRNDYVDVNHYVFDAEERSGSEVKLIVDALSGFAETKARDFVRKHVGIELSSESKSPFCFHHPQWYLYAAFNQLTHDEKAMVPPPLSLPTYSWEACNEKMVAQGRGAA